MATKKIKNEITVFGEMKLSTDDFIYDLNDTEAMYLIKQLDLSRADYGFTEKLCVYFLREMLKAPKEECTGPEQMVMLAKDKSYKV